MYDMCCVDDAGGRRPVSTLPTWEIHQILFEGFVAAPSTDNTYAATEDLDSMIRLRLEVELLIREKGL